MRKLFLLASLVTLAAGALGCSFGQSQCGESWHPGMNLFGRRNHMECCEPSYGSCGAMMGSSMVAPMTSAAPCCQ